MRQGHGVKYLALRLAHREELGKYARACCYYSPPPCEAGVIMPTLWMRRLRFRGGEAAYPSVEGWSVAELHCSRHLGDMCGAQNNGRRMSEAYWGREGWSSQIILVREAGLAKVQILPCLATLGDLTCLISKMGTGIGPVSSDSCNN